MLPPTHRGVGDVKIAPHSQPSSSFLLRAVHAIIPIHIILSVLLHWISAYNARTPRETCKGSQRISKASNFCLARRIYLTEIAEKQKKSPVSADRVCSEQKKLMSYERELRLEKFLIRKLSH